VNPACLLLVGEGRDGLLAPNGALSLLSVEISEETSQSRRPMPGSCGACVGAGGRKRLSQSRLAYSSCASQLPQRNCVFRPDNGWVWAGGVYLRFNRGRRAIGLRVGLHAQMHAGEGLFSRIDSRCPLELRCSRQGL
jgi:hypothetical protein